jgi:hypothetical protein
MDGRGRKHRKLMRALREVLVTEFYRRNLFFFGLILLLLFLVLRPPTLLVSEYFIGAMLEDIRFFGIVCGILCLYYAKSLFETQRSIHTRENRFLYELGALPTWQLLLLMAEQMLGVFLPAVIYAGVIAGYSLVRGTWHVWAIMGFHAALVGGASAWLVVEIRHPRERMFAREAPYSWLRWWTRSVPYLLFSLLWEQRRAGLLLTKGIVAGLLLLTLWAQAYDPMPVKGVLLLLMCLSCLQAMIPYWLLEGVRSQCQWLRNFPRSRIRRFGDYALVCGALWLPEGILMAGATGLWDLPLAWMGYYLLATAALFLLAVAALHYRAVATDIYLQWLFGAFAVLFFAILFALPQVLIYGFVILFSMWIFFDEYYEWRG